ncbi:hypothetical protein PG994_004480 [Apiospora phragmitis]|uniref:Uncharacterized protein n=1 Tax=Apiospora phragmitis TaxID=2905665 RepID=A0ABR1VTD4_9PEZI
MILSYIRQCRYAIAGNGVFGLGRTGQGENARTLSPTCPVLMGGYTWYIIRKKEDGFGRGLVLILIFPLFDTPFVFECAVIRGCFFTNGELDRRQCYYAIAWDGVLRPRRDRRQCCCAITRL